MHRSPSHLIHIFSLVLAMSAALWLPGLAVSHDDEAILDSIPADSTTVTLPQTIVVVGHRVTRTSVPFPFEKDRFNQVLTTNGFCLATRGGGLTHDIVADGFKRDDIAVVIDGERYHSACPNRMDSPLSRSNSLEMDAIELNKTSSSAASGIGGSVSYRRRPVGKQGQITAGISHSLGSSAVSDLGFAATSNSLRLSGRYAKGGTYDDGEGRSFVDLYGYLRDYDSKLAEVAATGEQNAFAYRTEFTYTENVLFPYLQMDERLNRVFAGSVSFHKNKLYLNHTSHLMDNRLRKSTSSMTTDATNTTVGLVGSHYELFYRRWYADNTIATPMMTIKNDLIPDARQMSVSLFHDGSIHDLLYWGRLGLTRYSIEEKERAVFYEPLYGDQSTDRTFASWGIGTAIRKQLTSGLSGVLTLDGAGEPPPPQALYIAVRRPMGKAVWSGNPGLGQPIRFTLRGRLNYRRASLELSATHVWDYADMVAASVGSQQYQTYANFDMRVFAAHLHSDWNHLSLASSYSIAEHVSTHKPLAEVPPFTLSYTLKSSEFRGARAYWRHTYSDAQTRVDETLKESRTGSWHRFDLGVTYAWSPLRFTLEIENVFDEAYSQHLSYLRDPFASGSRVYEPGRTVRFNLLLISSPI